MTENPYASPKHLDDQPSRPRKPGFRWLNFFLGLGVVMLLVMLMLPAIRTPGKAMQRAQCINNLKQISLALYNYESANGSLPPAYTVDSGGKPLHSWRTLILPYLEEEALYKSIDLTKSWDDPANAKAREIELGVYCCPANHCEKGHTTYLASAAPNGCFGAKEPRKLTDITDNHGETIAVMEVATDHAVHWMSPVDAGEALLLGRVDDLEKLAHPGGSNVAFVDGSVHFLQAKARPSDLQSVISINGNEKMYDFP